MCCWNFFHNIVLLVLLTHPRDITPFTKPLLRITWRWYRSWWMQNRMLKSGQEVSPQVEQCFTLQLEAVTYRSLKSLQLALPSMSSWYSFSPACSSLSALLFWGNWWALLLVQCAFEAVKSKNPFNQSTNHPFSPQHFASARSFPQETPCTITGIGGPSFQHFLPQPSEVYCVNLDTCPSRYCRSYKLQGT